MLPILLATAGSVFVASFDCVIGAPVGIVSVSISNGFTKKKIINNNNNSNNKEAQKCRLINKN